MMMSEWVRLGRMKDMGHLKFASLIHDNKRNSAKKNLVNEDKNYIIIYIALPNFLPSAVMA